MKKSNLKPFQAGVSGNPNGRPKGTRNIKNVIRDLLTDPGVYDMLHSAHPRGTQTPLEAIIGVLMIKSIRGDVRAADVLLKYAVDRDVPAEVGGFFEQKKLVIEVVGNRQIAELPTEDKITAKPEGALG